MASLLKMLKIPNLTLFLVLAIEGFYQVLQLILFSLEYDKAMFYQNQHGQERQHLYLNTLKDRLRVVIICQYQEYLFTFSIQFLL